MRVVYGVLVLLLFCAGVQGAVAAEEYGFVTKWGDSGQLGYPTDIAASNDGSVYVIDQNTVQKFSNTGAFIATWDRWNSTPSHVYLGGIAVDSGGTVFMGELPGMEPGDEDWPPCLVRKFSPSGAVLATPVTLDTTGYQVLGVAPGPGGVVYVGSDFGASAHYSRVEAYSSTGTLLWRQQWNFQNDEENPHMGDIASDASGNVYMVDSYIGRVVKYAPNGTEIARWGSDGSGPGAFRLPDGIAVDAKGDVYVADTYNNRIQKFRPDGTFVTAWGTEGSGDGQMQFPKDVAVDSTGYVYVLESLNHRVQKFAPTLNADFTVGSRTGYEPYMAVFSDTTTGGPTSWHWSFGDGGTSTLQNPSHTYQDGGTYTVELTVSSPFMTRTATKTNYITVIPTWNGLIRVEAEDYMVGGEGVAYHDTGAGNSGGDTYRQDDVDIAALGTRGHVVTRIAEGEWTRYQVSSYAAANAVYPLSLRLAGWADGQTVTVAVAGLAGSIDVAVPNTGSNAAYAYANASLRLKPGPNTIQFTYHGSAMNFDYFTLDPSKITPIMTIPGGMGAPLSISAAGKFDDVNGNTRKDFGDVVLYFNQMSWITANEPVEGFDYNGNGRIDFADVVWLFNHL